MRQNVVSRILGLALCLLSAFMLVRSARAGVAHGTYLHARYGLAGSDILELIGRSGEQDGLSGLEFRRLAWSIVRRCETADEHYGSDYRFCSLAADTAFQAAASIGEKKGSERKRLLDAARKWCESGLQLNFYSRKLRLRKAGLMRESGAKRMAAEYWADYTDWHFWYAQNHYLLAKLYVGSGDFQRAVQANRWCEVLTTRGM